MSRVLLSAILTVTLAVAVPRAAFAQTTMAGCDKAYSLQSKNPAGQRERRPDDKPDAPLPWVASGDVVIVCDDAQLFADEVEFYRETSLAKARGHVSFIEGTQRITADRFEFNTKTKLGTFWNAQGIMTVAGKVDSTSLFGATEADAYFVGEIIEKIGVNKYRLTNGHFTTCVQPTPRWEFVSSSVTLVKDRHAVMRNAVLRVKDVPVFYLPYFYYPINKENRATGFLMPSYGHSTWRGQMFSEAFFWAINRSQDATLSYDYSSKAGTGYGAEYRYAEAPGSTGNFKFSQFNGKSDAFDALLRSRSYLIDGQLTQQLPARWRLLGNINYSNSIQNLQLFHQSLLRSTYGQRFAQGRIQGSIAKLFVSAEAGITDVFTSTAAPTRYGSLPTVRVQLPATPIGASRVYVGVTNEFARLIRVNSVGNPATDRGLFRLDTNPTIRAPLGKLPYLSVQTVAGFHFTQWSEQLIAGTTKQVPGTLRRSLFDYGAEVTGPTFTRIFDTPGSGYATRWKHVIEPTFSINRTTAFQNFNLVPKNDQTDFLIGGVTNMTYGVANRLLAKRRTVDGVGPAQEVLSVQVQQSYYSDPNAALYDVEYAQSRTRTASNFSPIDVSVQVSPSQAVRANSRIEIDSHYKQLRTLSVGSTVQASRLSLNASWTKQFLIEQLTGFNNPRFLYHGLSTGASLHTPDNHLTASWSWTYDFQAKHQLQQQGMMAYMSQCCGLAVEYQNYYTGALSAAIQNDHRFNISFSLAGIGTFSNLLGSFGRQ